MSETNVGAVAQAELPPAVPLFELEPEAMFMLLTEDDLPCEDGVPMETERHRNQMYLLLEVLELYWAEREDWYASGNMFLYFSPRQIKTEHFRGPDFFAVLGVERRERKSYVVWQEGKIPDVIIELLSDSTREFDKTEKKRIYQDELRVPEYFWFDPHTHEWAGFELRDWQYEPIEPDEKGRLISKRLGLALSLREGWFQNHGGTWLRWETLDGHLLPSGEEMARTAQREAEAAQREAEAARRETQVSEKRATELEVMLAKYQAQFGKLPE
ncbi:MAG: Uma2 family endonuclease [Acidobacteriota bacterium]